MNQCKLHSSAVVRALNTRAKSLKDSGMSTEEAREQALQDIYEYAARKSNTEKSKEFLQGYIKNRIPESKVQEAFLKNIDLLFNFVNTVVYDLDVNVINEGNSWYKPSINTIALLDRHLEEITGPIVAIHELTHAATIYGINATKETDKDIVAFGNLLKKHQKDVAQYLKEKEIPAWIKNQLNYIYSDKDSLREGESLVKEAIAVLASSAQVRKYWVDMLLKIDPTTGKKSIGLFQRIIRAIKNKIKDFYEFSRNMDSIAGVKDTRALGLYYKAILSALESTKRANPTYILNPFDVWHDSASLGSQAGTTQGKTQQIWEEKLLTQGLQETFEKLGREDKVNVNIDSESHKKHLQGIISNVIHPLLSTLDGYTIRAEQGTDKDVATRGEANLTKKRIEIITGLHPIWNSLAMSAQEVLSHELIHAVTSKILNGKSALKGSPQLIQGVRKLFDLAKANITWQDLIPKDAQGNPIIPHGGTLADTEKAAKARWDYIFNTRDGIQEFVAYGNTNEQFMKLLRDIKVKKEISGDGTLLGAVKAWFQRAVDYLAAKVFHTEGENVAEALHLLTLEIAGLKKKHNYVLGPLGYAGEFARWAVSKPVQLIFRGIGAGIDTFSDDGTKRMLRALKYIPTSEKTRTIMSGLGYVADRTFKVRENFVYNLLSKLPSELVGMHPENAKFWARLRTSKGIIDVLRHKTKDAALKNFKDGFKEPLSHEEDRALYNLIAIDAPDLLKAYSYAEIADLMRDKGKLTKEIDRLNNKLIQAEGKYAHGLIRQAHGLGKFMVLKKTFNGQDQKLNVDSIVDLDFDSKAKINNIKLKDRDAAYADVELLKSLYAMQYVNLDKMKQVLTVWDREFKADPLDNGITNFMGMVGLHKVKSLEMNFGGKKKLTRAGYTSEIYDPNVQIQWSTDGADGALIAAGYTRVGDALEQGKGTKHQKQYMYVSNHNGLVAYTKAIISLTSEQQFGTNLSDVYRNQDFRGRDAYDQAWNDTQNILNSIKDPYNPKYDINDDSSMVPVSDEDGNTVGYRYVMEEITREQVLKKNYRASTVLSVMYEQMTDKYHSKDLNKGTVEDLIEDYKLYGVKRANDFIIITEKHPKYGELYKRIPETMKKDLDLAFGKGRMLIREPLVDLVFGFPNYSLTKEGLDNYVGETMMMIMGMVNRFRNKDDSYYKLSPEDQKRYKTAKAKILLRQVEQGWQEAVTEVKSTIVLKTMVLPFNIASNLFFSFMHGMPIDYILKKQAEAVIALQDYNEKLRRKMILEQKIEYAGISKEAKERLQGEINQLQADLDTNIVKSLIDKGVLNSIVEDIALEMDSDAYSMRGKITDWVEEKSQKIPEGIKTTYKWMYATKDTGLYKMLETATRYSDFVARYSMYEWLTKDSPKPVSEGEAMTTVMEAFVEYDPPTSKELQFLNDMGLFMFTKYAIRIQKAVARLFLDKPDTTIGLLALEKMVGVNFPTPVDAFAEATWNHVAKDLTVMTPMGVRFGEAVLPDITF